MGGRPMSEGGDVADIELWIGRCCQQPYIQALEGFLTDHSGYWDAREHSRSQALRSDDLVHQHASGVGERRGLSGLGRSERCRLCFVEPIPKASNISGRRSDRGAHRRFMACAASQ